MPLNKINKKPCDCPSESFKYVKKEYLTIEGPYETIHSYEVKECQVHKNFWGRRRKEQKVIRCVKPIKNYNLDKKDLDFFKSVFAPLWNEKINEKTWNKKIRKLYQNKSPEDITNSFIQKGIIYTKIIFVQKSNSEKKYIFFTSTGKEKIKDLIGFLSVEEQVSLGKAKLLEALTSELSENLDENQVILFSLLKDQFQKIESNDPKWITMENYVIVPKNSAINPPKYVLLLYGVCTWFQIYRENLTLREVSARAFQKAPIMKNEEPSKILDKYSQDLNSIIEKFSGKICDELGLILALDSFTFSGYLTLYMQDNKNIKIGGPSTSFSNLSYTRIKEIHIDTHLVLFIENYAVFAQLVLDNWALNNNVLLIYIKGMGISGHFRKEILRKILRDNPQVNVFIWVDYDLGGCNIYYEVLKNLEIENINIIYLPPDMSIPFRKIPKNQQNLLSSYAKSNIVQLRNFAKFILENGKVEQEYLLEWYDDILRYNYN